MSMDKTPPDTLLGMSAGSMLLSASASPNYTSKDEEPEAYPLQTPMNNYDAHDMGSFSEGTAQKKSYRACIRCRFRHTRCPGGQPCLKCQMAKTKCEYNEYNKRLVVSQKYLHKLQEDIVKLKKENASLRSSLKQEQLKYRAPEGPSSRVEQKPFNLPYALLEGLEEEFGLDSYEHKNEVIHPSLDKHGRLIQSQTGEKLYVGSSSMTLFGLEIQNMAPSLPNSNLLHLNSSVSTPSESPANRYGSPLESVLNEKKRETRILEKEGNAYNITLAKTNTRPGLSVNFTLPSYSYAILLVDTFINYNDGCFYFFNEGLVKRYLMNLYAGNNSENKKIIKRNISQRQFPSDDENLIKTDTDDDTILETIWFCKILLIFAIGEMYLGTDSDPHMKNLEENNAKKFAKNKTKKKPHGKRNTLPGSGFFYQASELFTGLFASGAIDNITKDGGIEVMLLYAFYLQVADCTIASYFYFGLALRSTLILGWHVDADMENLNRFELEHRRRIWWTVYMYERMLSSKAGLPLSFADDSVSTELPFDFDISLESYPADDNDVRGYFIFPSSEYINNCVTITQINAIILSSLYTKQPTANILPVVSDLVQKLFKWKSSLPSFLLVDFSAPNFTISRLIVNLMTEYFQGMNLAVRPLLFHFATKKLKELQSQQQGPKYVDLSKYSKNVLTLLNASFQASINTIKSIWALLPQNMVALFGWMDREYLFTSASTLILFNASFGVHDATCEHLDHALSLFTKMKKLGNYPAALRRAQLLKLIKVLDFNGVMSHLLYEHDDDHKTNASDLNVPMDLDHGMPLNTLTAPQILRQSPEFSLAESEPLQSDLDFIQFNGPVPSTTRAASKRHTPAIAPTEDLKHELSFQPQQSNFYSKGDVFPNSDLEGIEGVTYLDEEQQLWNEITNDAGWLQPSGVPNATGFKNEPKIPMFGDGLNKPPTSPNLTFIPTRPSMGNMAGAYSDIINMEFQDDLF